MAGASVSESNGSYGLQRGNLGGAPPPSVRNPSELVHLMYGRKRRSDSSDAHRHRGSATGAILTQPADQSIPGGLTTVDGQDNARDE